MSSEINDKFIVSSEILAQLFGMTARRVNQLAKEEIIDAIRDKGVNRFDLTQTVPKYIRHLNNKAAEKGGDGKWEDIKLKAEAEWKRSKAAILQMQQSELENHMHSSEDVEAVMTDMVLNIRGMLLALPGRLAMDVAQTVSAAEASEVIRREVHHVLNELADYQYDPEVFALRVRDRQGWGDRVEEETDE